MIHVVCRLLLGVLFSYIVLTPTAYADVADLQREMGSSCATPALSTATVRRLPSDLAKYRNQIEALEQQASASMQSKSDAFVKRGKWSESAEEGFFRQLVSSEQFQSYEKQRTDLIQAYMQATEGALDSAVRSDHTEGCKASVVLVMVMKELLKLTEQQWCYMLSEQEVTLAKTLNSSSKPQNAEAEPGGQSDLARKAAQGR